MVCFDSTAISKNRWRSILRMTEKSWSLSRPMDNTQEYHGKPAKITSECKHKDTRCEEEHDRDRFKQRGCCYTFKQKCSSYTYRKGLTFPSLTSGLKCI